MTDTHIDTWLDTEELATYLRMPVNTLVHWRKQGQGPVYHKFGRRVRYARADIDAWVATKAMGRPA